jgi:hypothetical protein
MPAYNMFLIRRAYPDLYELVYVAMCTADDVHAAYDHMLQNKFADPDKPGHLTADIMTDDTDQPDQLWVCFDAHAPGDHPAFFITRADLPITNDYAPTINAEPAWPYRHAMIAAGYDMP